MIAAKESEIASIDRPGESRISPTPATGLRAWLARNIPLLVLGAVMILVALVRLRLASVPLERDEGEYAYAGQLILQGIPPYELVYNMKFPGTYYAYSLILALFGQTPQGIHLGLLVINAATTLLVYALAKRLLGTGAACVAGISFAVLSLDRWILGVFAHATHFVLPFALAGLLLLLRGVESGRRRTLVLGGVLFGVAVLMKQHAIVFLPMAALLLLWLAGNGDELRARSRTAIVAVGVLALGAAIPIAVAFAWMFAEGVFTRFWRWTFLYASEYVSQVPPSLALRNLAFGWGEVSGATSAFWYAAAIGLLLLWVWPWHSRARVVVTALLVASLLAISPGFYYREHYFILLLPAVSMLVGVAFATLAQAISRVGYRKAGLAIATMAFLFPLSRYISQEFEYLHSMTPLELSRSRYGENPFPEAVEIARYIGARTRPTDRIVVLGSEPEIYFYAGRHSGTGYIYTYALMEPQVYSAAMQQDMMRQILEAQPKYIVFVQIEASWLIKASSDLGIVDWGNRFVASCYDLAGIADVHSSGMATMAWDEDVRTYQPRSAHLVYTFRKKGDAPCFAEPPAAAVPASRT